MGLLGHLPPRLLLAPYRLNMQVCYLIYIHELRVDLERLFILALFLEEDISFDLSQEIYDIMTDFISAFFMILLPIQVWHMRY